MAAQETFDRNFKTIEFEVADPTGVLADAKARTTMAHAAAKTGSHQMCRTSTTPTVGPYEWATLQGKVFINFADGSHEAVQLANMVCNRAEAAKLSGKKQRGVIETALLDLVAKGALVNIRGKTEVNIIALCALWKDPQWPSE